MNFWQQLQFRLKQFNIAEKIILINVVCFVLPLFLNTILFLFNISSAVFLSWFELPASLEKLVFRPWSLITYSFFHSGFFHLFWNMVLLYFSGRLFLNLFNDRTFINTYFLGVLSGGLIFVLSYSIFPAFRGIAPAMIGASAGVMAVFIFVCTYSPDQEVRFFFFDLKLRYLGIAFVLLDVIQIPYGNAGGHLAHIGGAALGFFYAQQLQKGIDIGTPFENFVNAISDLFTRKKSMKTMKTVHKSNKNNQSSGVSNAMDVNQQKIDSILDKISKSGYESLSKEEKDFLFRAGKD